MTILPYRKTELAIGAVAALMLLASARPAAATVPNCGMGGCGHNTAELRKTMIKGLNVQDVVNPDGVRLVRGSLTLFFKFGMPSACFGRSGSGYSVAVANGALYTTVPGSGTVLPTACLDGSTFDVDVPVVTETGTILTQRVRLEVHARNTVSTWHTSASARTTVPTYELIDIAKGVSICPVNGSWMETFHTPQVPTMPAGVSGMSWYTPTDHALIVQGETYDDTITIDPARSNADWFNIACAGSALADSRLMGYDPMATTTTAAARQSTLKMITAHYLSGFTESWTVTGTPLTWTSNPAVSYYNLSSGLPQGPIEAYWNADGVMCLSHLRVMNSSTSEAREDDELTKIRARRPVPACTSQAPSGWLWRTTTVDHIDS